jgi:hypothetical protein
MERVRDTARTVNQGTGTTFGHRFPKLKTHFPGEGYEELVVSSVYVQW